MITIDEHVAHAPADTCFRVAADVEGWPDILPHYRWVRFHEKEAFATGIVEMAAWRPFGPVKYPTWWVSEMEHDPDRRRVVYRHIDGITTGMDVVWEVRALDEKRSHLRIVHEWSGPRWPLIRGLAADLVIGPVFINHIAGRTLAGVSRAAERAAVHDGVGHDGGADRGADGGPATHGRASEGGAADRSEAAPDESGSTGHRSTGREGGAP